MGMTHSSPCLPSAFGRTPGMSRQGKMASLPALLPSLMAIISPWKFFHEYDGLGAGKRNLQKGRGSHSSAVLDGEELLLIVVVRLAPGVFLDWLFGC